MADCCTNAEGQNDIVEKTENQTDGCRLGLPFAEYAQVPNVAVQERMSGMKETHSHETSPRVLLFSPFFFPEPISTGKANTHLVEALAAHGAETTVVCSHPLYPDWVPVRSTTSLSGVTILRGGAWMRYSKHVSLRRVALEAWFAVYAAYTVLRARHLRSHTDVVIGVFPPSLFALGTHLLLPRYVRRIAVIHDLQGVLAGQRESAVRRMITRLIHAVESRVFRQQDLCIFFSADMAKEAQQSYGLDASHVAVQYPFVTIDNGRASSIEHADRLEGILPTGKIHVVYSGALGLKQNSEQFVALLHAAAKRFPDVQFHVFSGGPIFERLRLRYQGVPEAEVHFHPLVEERDLEELYRRSAIQMIPQAEKTEAGALPSKLPNLLAAGVFIFAITSPESEVARLLEEAGTGMLVEQWREALFLQRLKEALCKAQGEPSAARRQQVQPLLARFTVDNLVNLVFGTAQPEPRGNA